MVLLHIGDSLTQHTFDPWVGVLALALFSATALAIWTPASKRRRTARRLARTAVALAVFLAILPTVLPYDHILQPAAGHADGNASVHETHCHGTPGSCSDAPVTSGAGQFLTAEPLLTVLALTALLMVLVIPTLIGHRTRPVLRPPLSLASA